MIGTLFHSDDVPVENRFEYWRELTQRAIAPSVMTSPYADDFYAQQRLMELGPVVVWPTMILPTRFLRTERMVRQCDPEIYHLTLLLGGGLGLDHVGRADVYGPRDLWLTDSSRPYDVGPPTVGDDHLVTGVGVDFPKSLLPLSPERVQPLLGRRLPGQEGTGALLSGFLTGLTRESETLKPADAPRLGAVLVDLLAAWFAQVVEAEAALSPETRQRALVAHIKAFVRENLHDPELTPPVVAAAHHISLSYLHRLFQEDARGETVAAWIRAQRLEGARRDLANPALHATPIRAIAARWGLVRAPDFARAFRTAYGMSPREYREQSLQGAR
ncbi:AraC family transcriptional regulator [Streptomyces sp. NPDC091279]|uniref:AraC family transcriptional regulator n=1 Tax=unclassified Streptomyces TaxID=2593676 RepID=UPI003801315A